MRARIRRYFLPVSLCVLVVLSVANAWLNIERARQPASTGVPEDLAKVWEAYATIQRQYVHQGSLDPDKLADGAVRGMVESLDDPFATYFDATEYQHQVAGDLAGKFEGIGATVMSDGNGGVAIASLIPGSPAEKAGLAPGDVILKVNGASVEGLTVAEVVVKIRGPRETPVLLTVKAAVTEELSDVTIIRASIQFPTVASTALGNGITQVRISQFAPQTTGELDVVLKKLADEQTKAIVLDLRNNLGGLLTVVVGTASEFIDSGLILAQVDASGKRTELNADGKGQFTTIPVVVLVNEFSASGSEVVAGALQARGRAKLVGTRTYGKGVANLPVKLADGSGLYLPIATWYTPAGVPIGHAGLTPDIIVERTMDDLYAGRDPQMDQALEVLRVALGQS